MAISTSSQSAAIWAFIIQALKNEMNVGPTGPGTGTNPGGRLQTLQYVHGTIHLWSDELPAIGVQIVDDKRSQGWQRAQDTDIEFKIVAAAKATAASDGSITLDSAFSALMPIIDDGSGNGLVPILEDRTLLNSIAGGLTMFNRIARVQYDWDVDKAVGATDARAYAYIDYVCQTITAN